MVQAQNEQKLGLSSAGILFLLFLQLGEWVSWWVGVEIKVDANSAPTELELELGLSLAKL